MSLPPPVVTPLTEPYYAALAEGRLTIQRCPHCGHAWLPAREECPACLRPGPVWENASGRGEIVSFVVYHIAYDKAFEGRLPYNVAVVQLDEGARMLSNVLAPTDRLKVGARVSVKVEHEEGFSLARFTLD